MNAINVDTAGVSLPLNQGWKVSFKPGLGAPESVLLSAGRVTFSTWKFFDKESPLLDSGLLGPVKLDAAHRFTLEPSSKSEAHKD